MKRLVRERMEMEKLSHCHGVTSYSEGGRAEYRYASIREGKRNKIENKRSRKVSKEERAHGRKIGHREPTHPSLLPNGLKVHHDTEWK